MDNSRAANPVSARKPWLCRFRIHDWQEHRIAGPDGYVTHRACLLCCRVEIPVPLYNPPKWDERWMEITQGHAFIAARDAENALARVERETRIKKAAEIVKGVT